MRMPHGVHKGILTQFLRVARQRLSPTEPLPQSLSKLILAQHSGPWLRAYIQDGMRYAWQEMRNIYETEPDWLPQQSDSLDNPLCYHSIDHMTRLTYGWRQNPNHLFNVPPCPLVRHVLMRIQFQQTFGENKLYSSHSNWYPVFHIPLWGNWSNILSYICSILPFGVWFYGFLQTCTVIEPASCQDAADDNYQSQVPLEMFSPSSLYLEIAICFLSCVFPSYTVL